MKPPYTRARLYVDGIPDLRAGHYIKTPAGSAYLVLEVRPSPSKASRRYLDCMRWPMQEIPADAIRHTLHWYPRAKATIGTLRPRLTRA